MTVSALDDKHSADQLGHRIHQLARQHSSAARTTHIESSILFSERRPSTPPMRLGFGLSQRAGDQPPQWSMTCSRHHCIDKEDKIPSLVCVGIDRCRL